MSTSTAPSTGWTSDSYTHVISIVGIGATLIFLNLIYFKENPLASADLVALFQNNFGWLAGVDAVGIGGMSYYAVQFAANATGITYQNQATIPVAGTPIAATPLPAGQAQTLTIGSTQLSQIVGDAVTAALANQAKPATTSATAPAA